MQPALVPLLRLLDPRPSALAASEPIAESVNIADDELHGRMHELPPRHGRVLIAGPEPWAGKARDLLLTSGREAEISTEWTFGQSQKGRLWQPNEFLLQTACQLTPGRALELACGSGRDAVTLGALGWEVVAIDHLEDALELGRDLACRYAPEASISWQKIDLERQVPEGEFDLISMAWYLNRDLIRHAVKLLRPGGSLVVETFTETHRARFGKPRTEAYVLKDEEILRLSEPLRIQICEEGWHNDRHSARLWAVK